MSQIIITVSENKDCIDLKCEGEFNASHLLYMVTEGLDKLKGDFCHHLIELNLGLVKEENNPPPAIKKTIDKILDDLEKKS